ncbi:PREDICTED: uncharacterized protein LOC104777198 isoform X2 [Camelina sativa]|uniref:Uncharacterized protein LOC104777198 isoform X2 n=1 Tax=Camelina sativa TaxID=90675 RepID=A0ABM1REC6_CAMSA|nr:PREDICTED: uncharacterized protein LOC104777198 isoform X2 [Camelina sativa]
MGDPIFLSFSCSSFSLVLPRSSCAFRLSFRRLSLTFFFKGKDLKWDGESCYLPENHAFGLGIAALVCVSVAQIVGNVVVCRGFLKTDKTGTTPLCIILLLISWVIFAVAVTLISVGASMNIEQRYGKGWLNRECYLVKDGVFAGSGVLCVTTLVAILGAFASKAKPSVQGETQDKRHTQNV